MDLLVAKLVMEFAQLTNRKPNSKPTLSELLPWGFTFNDLHFYSKRFSPDKNLIDFRNEAYSEEQIEDKFRMLQNENKECYINFDLQKLNQFRDKTK